MLAGQLSQTKSNEGRFLLFIVCVVIFTGVVSDYLKNKPTKK